MRCPAAPVLEAAHGRPGCSAATAGTGSYDRARPRGRAAPRRAGRGRGPGRATAMTAGLSWSPRPATATTRSAWPAGSSTPTGRPARSAPCTTRREPDGVLSRPAAPAGSPAARPVRPPTGPMPTSSWPPASGGKGVPETVAAHPRLFVTFTAPSLRPGPHPQGPRAPGAAVSPVPPRCPLPPRPAGWLLAPP